MYSTCMMINRSVVVILQEQNLRAEGILEDCTIDNLSYPLEREKTHFGYIVNLTLDLVVPWEIYIRCEYTLMQKWITSKSLYLYVE